MEQTKPNKNKWISFLADGILSGLMLGIGGMVSLSSENRFLGAFLFSLGLFCIVQFKYGLFTGKVGYIVNRDLPYVAETAVTLVGNALGTLIAALLFGSLHQLLAQWMLPSPIGYRQPSAVKFMTIR